MFSHNPISPLPREGLFALCGDHNHVQVQTSTTRYKSNIFKLNGLKDEIRSPSVPCLAQTLHL